MGFAFGKIVGPQISKNSQREFVLSALSAKSAGQPISGALFLFDPNWFF
jgi:hypothetical protein